MYNNNNFNNGFRSNNYHNNNMNRVPKRIYVGGIPIDASQDELRDYFATFGPVTDARIIMDPVGQSRGYGFITYENENDASRVLGLGEEELVFKENKLSVGQAFRNQRNDQQRQFNNYGNNGGQQFNNNSYPNNNGGGGGGYRPNNAYRNNDAFRTDANSQYNNVGFAYDQQYKSMDGRFFRN